MTYAFAPQGSNEAVDKPFKIYPTALIWYF